MGGWGCGGRGATHRGWRRPSGGPAVCAVALIGLAVAVQRPAVTAPIAGAGREPWAGGVAELATVRVGGHDTTVMLRGQDTAAPVLLYLAGGPGGTDLGAMRLFGEQLERDFVVATWDQRGAGTSYGALDPTSSLTLDQTVSDTIELAEQLAGRFDQERVYLVGNSWGHHPWRPRGAAAPGPVRRLRRHRGRW